MILAADGDSRIFAGFGNDTISLGSILDHVVGDVDDLSGNLIANLAIGEIIVITALVVGSSCTYLSGLIQDAGTATQY